MRPKEGFLLRELDGTSIVVATGAALTEFRTHHAQCDRHIPLEMPGTGRDRSGIGCRADRRV